jgi:hypothetical protein
MVHSLQLKDEFEILLKEYGLSNNTEKFDEKARLKLLLDSYEKGEIDSLGIYGKKLLDSVFTEPRFQSAHHEAVINDFPLFDGSGKVGRYLKDICRVLNDMNIPLAKEIYFEEFPTRQFNACVKPTPSGLLCLLNTGLLKLIYHVAVVSFGSVYGEINLNKVDKNFSLLDISTLAVIRIIINYLNGKDHTHVLIDGFSIEDDGLFAASGLSYAIRLFVLAHEIGHIALGHSENLGREIIASHAVDVVESEVNTEKYENKVIVSRSQTEEFEADKFAQEILLHIDERKYFLAPIASGGLGFLIIHLMIITVYSKISGISVADLSQSESHPSSLSRIKMLDELLSVYYSNRDDRENLSNCIVLQKVLSKIEQSTIVQDGEDIIVQIGQDGHCIKLENISATF